MGETVKERTAYGDQQRLFHINSQCAERADRRPADDITEAYGKDPEQNPQRRPFLKRAEIGAFFDCLAHVAGLG